MVTEGIEAERPRPVRWPIYLVVGLVTLALLARAVTFLGLLTDEPTPTVSAAGEGETWSFRQLMEYLRACDVPLAVVTTQERAAGGPVVSVCAEAAAPVHSSPVVDIQRRPTSADAADAATARGGESFAWGRFLFTGDGDLLDRIRRYLR